MQPRIETLPLKKFIGKRLKMSFANIQTFKLWSGFMPKRKEIKNVIGSELYSMEVYKPKFFQPFDATAEFDKWAAVEVSDFNTIPAEMENISAEGLYAVFLFIGIAKDAEPFYRNIFTKWLPASEYDLDDRPHFAVMGEKYKKDDPSSEEEVWIPVKLKNKLK